MILQALESYYRRIANNGDSGIAPEGFQSQSIPFIIVLDSEGCLKDIQDTRQGEGKKKTARSFTVPRAVKRTVGVDANLLWDNPGYVFARPKPDKKKDGKDLAKRAQEQHADFKAKVREIFLSTGDDGAGAVVKFLENGDFSRAFAHPHWQEIEDNGANLSFMLEGDLCLVCQREAVVKGIAQNTDTEGNGSLPCLVTGSYGAPVRLHAAIKGVWGAQTSGANIISFNLSAFNSYGKEQGFNAPVGAKAGHAYTTALNTLLAKDSRQRMQVGDASTVFWAERESVLEDIFSDIFGEPPKGQAAQCGEAIKALYSSPNTGAPPLEEDLTMFYVLGLSPNASRISIRFWHAGTVSEVAKNIKQHFEDCMVVRGPKDPEHLSLFRLLVSTAPEGKADNIQPSLSGELIRAVLTGAPYPATLLSAAVRRIKAEHEITYARASLVKALLVRQTRYYNKKEKEVGMSLDDGNRNTGYLLGRLFAVLERAQEFANPGINATIRDRFYGAASSTPGSAFPYLMKLKNHHISKIDNKGSAVNLEKQIGGIIDGLGDFPTHLSLQDQGRFALGYYHQRQNFFTKKERE